MVRLLGSSWRYGNRLTKDYDATIQGYRISQPTIKISKMPIFRCPLNFAPMFGSIHCKIGILGGGKFFKNHPILDFWHLKS